jgi:hypothetical protein
VKLRLKTLTPKINCPEINGIEIFNNPPTVPTGLVARMDTPVEVDLAWTASTDSAGTIAGYKVLRNGTQIGTSTTLSCATQLSPQVPPELSPNFGDGLKDQAAAWA